MNFTYEKNETGKHFYTFSHANELLNFVIAAGKHSKSQLFTYV